MIASRFENFLRYKGVPSLSRRTIEAGSRLRGHSWPTAGGAALGALLPSAAAWFLIRRRAT